MKNYIFVLFLILSLFLVTGCGNNRVNVEPNIINPDNSSSLAINIEWPEQNINGVTRKAPPSYLGLTTVEVFLMEKDFARTTFGDSFIEYVENMENYHDMYHSLPSPKKSGLNMDFVSSIKGTEFEDKLYYYDFDVTTGSQYENGAKIDSVVVGNYIIFFYGLQSSGYVNTYAMKSVSIQENTTSTVSVSSSDWITNSPDSNNSISIISGNLTTPTGTTTIDTTSYFDTTVTEGVASSLIEYIFTYDGNISNINFLPTVNYVNFTSTPSAYPTASTPSYTTISSGTYKVSFSLSNISTISIPTDGTNQSGFVIGLEIYETIDGSNTGVSDFNNFTLYIQDSGTPAASGLNLVSFAVTSVIDYDSPYYFTGAGNSQDPRTTNASSIADIKGASIDIALDSSNTNQKIIIIYEDVSGVLTLHAGANPVAGTDFKFYKADDVSQTDLSSGIFTSASGYTATDEKGIELLFDNTLLEDFTGLNGYGSYILEVYADKDGTSITDKFHIFLEKGLYSPNQSSVTGYNNGLTNGAEPTYSNMTSVDGTGHFETGKSSSIVYSAINPTVNGYTKFYASCEVSVSPYNYILTIPVESSDQISSGLKVLTTTDIAYYGLGADTSNTDSLYLISLINNGFEFNSTQATPAAGVLAKTTFVLSSTSSNQYDMEIRLTGITQNDITSLPTDPATGNHVCWYSIHLVNKEEISSGVYTNGRKYIFFGKIYFKIQV